jgi:cytochrome c
MSASLAIAAIAALSGSALAADLVTEDEAMAMVKDAAIKSEGPEKAYAEFNSPSGKFVDRDLYIVVHGLDGMVLAHGANKSRIGTNQIDDKDPTARPTSKSASTSPSKIQASSSPTNS